MAEIIITLAPDNRHEIEITAYPDLTSEHKPVNKGIGILRRHAPGILRYLSKQRIMSHLPAYLIEIRGAGKIAEDEIRRRLGGWMRRKRNRRLVYVILELLLMPLTAVVAILPGPNIVFYGVFVLFYFHFKAFLSLSRIKETDLNIFLANKLMPGEKAQNDSRGQSAGQL